MENTELCIHNELCVCRCRIYVFGGYGPPLLGYMNETGMYKMDSGPYVSACGLFHAEQPCLTAKAHFVLNTCRDKLDLFQKIQLKARTLQEEQSASTRIIFACTLNTVSRGTHHRSLVVLSPAVNIVFRVSKVHHR